MSAEFVTRLRVGSTVRAGSGSGAPLVIRAQLLDAWDAVRVETTADSTVREVKEAVLRALDPSASPTEDYVVKLGGFEVLDENASLSGAGVTSGSILSIGHRFRRPVR
jgi:hypothetical protein